MANETKQMGKKTEEISFPVCFPFFPPYYRAVRAHCMTTRGEGEMIEENTK